MNKTPLHRLFVQYLLSRAVSVPIARANGFYSATREEAAVLLGFSPPDAQSYGVIPDRSGVGAPRVILLERADPAAPKALTPKGATLGIFVPSGVPLEADLIVVESAVKAVAVASVTPDACVVGLCGVSTCLNNRRLNSSWPSVTGRSVTILFDSDMLTNWAVVTAAASQCSALASAGATVRFALIPKDAHGKDQGPDDLIASGPEGVEILKRALSEALPADVAAFIDEKGSEILDSLLFLALYAAARPIDMGAIEAALRKAGIAKKTMAAAVKVAKRASASRGSSEVFEAEGKLWKMGPSGRELFCSAAPAIVAVFPDIRGATLFDIVVGDRRVHVPAAELRDRAWVLRYFGADVQLWGTGPAAAAELANWMTENASAAPRVIDVPRLGKLPGLDAFVHGGGVIGEYADVAAPPDSLKRYDLPSSFEGAAETFPRYLRLARSLPDGAALLPALFVLTSVTAEWVPRGVSLYFFGPTGAGKTAFATALASLWGDFSTPNLSLSSTANATEAAIREVGPFPFVWDDLVLADDVKGLLIAMVDRILRDLANGTLRHRCDQTGALASALATLINASLIVTGEEMVTRSSLRARAFPVRIPAGALSFDAIAEWRAWTKSVPHRGRALGTYMVAFCLKNGDALQALTSRMETIRSAFSAVAGHAREATNVAALTAFAELAVVVGGALGIYDSHGFLAHLNEVHQAAKAWFRNLDGATDEVGDFVEWLKSTIGAGIFTTEFGTVEAAYVFLRPERWRTLGYKGLGEQELMKRLREKGICEPEEGHAVYRRGKHREAFHRLNRAKIDSYVAAQPPEVVIPPLPHDTFAALVRPDGVPAWPHAEFVDGLDGAALAGAAVGVVVDQPPGADVTYVYVATPTGNFRCTLDDVAPLGDAASVVSEGRLPFPVARHLDATVTADLCGRPTFAVGALHPADAAKALLTGFETDSGELIAAGLDGLIENEVHAAVAIGAMADRGLPVDVRAFAAAREGLRAEREDAAAAFEAITNVPPDVDDVYLLKALAEHGAPTAISKAALAACGEAGSALLKFRRTTRSLAWLDDLEAASKDGRVYATWRVSGARTGRTTCAEPPLQQFPKDARVRACVAAPPGMRFVRVDVSQFELRVAAALSGDPQLLEAFRAGVDPHMETATKVFGDDAKAHRQFAKRANFLILNGGGAGTLARELAEERVDYPEEMALDLVEGFHSTYPTLAAYLAAAAEEGLPSALGRPNTGTKPSERINFPIQASAAEAWKSVLRDLHEAGDAIVVNVHDELLIEVAAERADADVARIKRRVEQSLEEFFREFTKSDCPFVVTAHVVRHWGE